jgi:hypothetical protein
MSRVNDDVPRHPGDAPYPETLLRFEQKHSLTCPGCGAEMSEEGYRIEVGDEAFIEKLTSQRNAWKDIAEQAAELLLSRFLEERGIDKWAEKRDEWLKLFPVGSKQNPQRIRE